MSTRASHATQVTANEQLAQHLATLHSDPQLGDTSRQWQMTLLFYAAVHWVEHQFQHKSYPASFDHQTRKKRLRQIWVSQKPAIRAYLLLEHFSRRARYEGWIPTDADLQDAQHYLTHVKTSLI
ncbi:hypothetical protein [Sulfobacillus thermosulfidooxidans]|uniref:hypothetical protein n=1 Tax=Sulfobacillus thermosulfidooxidans TaxID=28034 RepID=UPI0006B5A9FE|nr:hypothetical protein [Sulfobacillus thermosulfidooxidans]